MTENNAEKSRDMIVIMSQRVMEGGM